MCQPSVGCFFRCLSTKVYLRLCSKSLFLYHGIFQVTEEQLKHVSHLSICFVSHLFHLVSFSPIHLFSFSPIHLFCFSPIPSVLFLTYSICFVSNLFHLFCFSPIPSVLFLTYPSVLLRLSYINWQIYLSSLTISD